MGINLKFLWLIILMELIFAGCGSSKSPRRQADLAQSDLEAFGSFNSIGAEQIDHQYHNRFSQIFGGRSGENLRNFIHERLKHFIQEKDMLIIEPFPKRRLSVDQTNAQKKFIVQASNIGTSFWIIGLLDNTFYTLTLPGGQKVVADHSRVGLVLLGEGYGEDKIQEIRQATLIHEARHSDCTGGVTQTQVSDLAFQIQLNESEGLSKALESKLFPRACGHLHKICQRGDYRGFPACDSESWGAYGIELVFVNAVLNSIPRDPTDPKWQMLEMSRIDLKSRLEFEGHPWDAYETMMSDPLNHPDLTSQGLQP